MKILIAEDERVARLTLQRQLEQMGYDVVVAADGREAWELFQSDPPPIVICDWEMPEMNGVELVERIRAFDASHYVYIVMLTGRSEVEDVVTGMEAGADDFITKPFHREELRARLRAGERILDLEQSLAFVNDRLRHELAVARDLADDEHRRHEESLLGDSIAIGALREAIERHATGDGPLLLTGPSGAGRQAVARAIHRKSSRCDRPFIYVACVHLDDPDASLFAASDGERHETCLGKAALAKGGTLYLEGIESLNAETQSKLAEFLRRVGAQRTGADRQSIDVRVVAAVSIDPSEAVKQGQLDAELVRLLGEHRLAVPSLAERRDDILAISESVLSRCGRAAGKAVAQLSPESEELLRHYSWPGNVRELVSVVERAVLHAKGSSVEIPAELLREGRRIGGYTLERQLGSGAMGEVWLGQHALLARPAAVKLIRQKALQGDSEARAMLEKRFEREAQATSRLRSPHTVELYDFGLTPEGDFYYVMEYLSGLDLESLVAKHGALPPARAVFLLSQACLSLGEAHRVGLIHRDVKPANFLACCLGPHYDFVKLLDFGIVKSTVDVGQTVTSAGQLKGTPITVSPEVVQGEEAGFESDVYGLGCVAYRLLTGEHVFETSNAMALMLQHLTERPTPLSEIQRDLPKELDELVLRCLAKNPADRPSSAFELGEALASIPLDDSWDNALAQEWWHANMPDTAPDGSGESIPDTAIWGTGDTD
jgi:eukaryotic-like serine/threonine-protein kinase